MCGPPPSKARPLRCAARNDLEVTLKGRGFSRAVMSFLDNAALSPKKLNGIPYRTLQLLRLFLNPARQLLFMTVKLLRDTSIPQPNHLRR